LPKSHTAIKESDCIIKHITCYGLLSSLKPRS